jgi:hypothetical protein
MCLNPRIHSGREESNSPIAYLSEMTGQFLTLESEGKEADTYCAFPLRIPCQHEEMIGICKVVPGNIHQYLPI